MHLKCWINAQTCMLCMKMHEKCIRNESDIHEKCMWDAWKMHNKCMLCMTSAWEMHLKCMSNAWEIHRKSRFVKHREFKKTYTSKSISQSKWKRRWNQQRTQHVDGGGGNTHVEEFRRWRLMENGICEIS